MNEGGREEGERKGEKEEVVREREVGGKREEAGKREEGGRGGGYIFIFVCVGVGGEGTTYLGIDTSKQSSMCNIFCRHILHRNGFHLLTL